VSINQFINRYYIEQYFLACAVDCCNVQDVSKTRCIFEFLCPPDMEITIINKSYGNGEQLCGWEVLYAFKAETKRQCNVEDAKNTFSRVNEGF
jgi:hypothetical protein